MTRTALILIITLFLSNYVEAGDKGEIEILISERVEVSGNSLFLGDIASIMGDRESKKSLESLYLGKSPSPGSYRILRRRRLEAYLEKNGWNDVKIRAPEKIEVWRRGIEVPKGELENEVKRTVAERMPWNEEMVEINVVIPKKLPLMPTGDVEFKIELPRNYSFLGKESILVKLLVDGKKSKSIWVKTDIKIFSDMIVASRPILRNEVLREGYLQAERRLVASLPKGIFNNVSEIVGMRAKRRITKGSVILESDIALPPIVKRGGMVTIVAEKGPLTISTMGKAMEKGYRGKLVRIENISSRKVILAEVVDPKTVKVGF